MTRPALRHHAAFSTIELMVTIGIVAVVAALVIVTAAQIRTSAKDSQARAMLGGLNGISAEIEATTTKPVSHLADGLYLWDDLRAINNPDAPGFSEGDFARITGGLAPGEGDGDSDKEQDAKRTANLLSERFVWAAYRIPTARDALLRLGSNALVDEDEDGFFEIRDPWGHCIAYAAFSTHRADAIDDFLPSSTIPFFASAGSDGLWGEAYTESEIVDGGTPWSSWSNYTGSDEYAHSRDNLYSSDLDRTSEATE